MGKKSGPFVPTTQQSMRISMAGDDCSLHFDLAHLTPKQQTDHVSNQVLTGMLQVALLYMAKPNDVVCLYDTFRDESRARDALGRYQVMFSKLGLSPPEPTQWQYHPREGFYESVAARESTTDLENLYMVSGSNLSVHQSQDAWDVSKNLNSKVHFASHAPGFGISVPATLHCRKSELVSPAVAAFLETHGTPIMLKVLGLAGARNVTTVNDIDEALAYVADYADDLDVLLQQRLDTSQYTEMTVDLCVSDSDIQITNVRRIMFADGLWVGNLLGPDVTVSDTHHTQLLKLGEYARSHGYSSSLGYNLGIDYFVRREDAPRDVDDLVVTEINARWTGGLFPAELVRRLQLQDQQVVAFIDMCPPARFGAYLDYLEDHLYQGSGSLSNGGFAMAPMGFAPYPTDLEGTDYLFVWQIVIGDFEAFKRSKQTELGDDALITAPVISVVL